VAEDAERGLTHVNEAGAVHMVDVGEKPATIRVAVAEGRLRARPETLALIGNGTAAKGDVLAVARVAAIMAAKRTSDLIPLCHPLALSGVEVDVQLLDDAVLMTVRVRTTGPTGAEMEALTAVSAGLLTVYDMLKAVERGMVVEQIRLVEKSGGRSGHYRRQRT
jgi:cyclic pyranopterin phosphate synthase